MANALDIRDQESLGRWLEDKPAEWAQLIALRAALRVFPLALLGQDKASNPGPARFQGLTLAVWRALLISSVARKYRTDEMRAAADAARAAAAAFAARAAAFAARAAAFAARAAAAAFAARAAADAARAAAADAARAAAAADAARAAAAAFAARAAAWEAIRCDCAILGRDGPGKLETAPLWLTHDDVGDPDHEPEPVIATPDWVKSAAARMEEDLTKLLGPDAGLIADWYRPLLNGEVNANRSRMFMGGKARTLALKDDAFWEVTEERPGEQVMEGIARVLGWGRWSHGLDSEPSDLEPISDFIIRYIESEADPVSIDMIRARFDRENYSYVDSTLRRELGTLAREGRIKRVRRGWYGASEKNTGQQTPPLPAFGKQGAGAKLGIVGGVVALTATEPAADDGSDYNRIGKFLPMAREAVEELLASIPIPESEGANDPHFRLRKQALNYLRHSENDLGNLDYDLLFGIGTLLQNRLAAAEKPSLEPDLVPLSDRQLTALRDFRATHGPMITASTSGQKLIRDADEFERNPERERRYRSVAADFAGQLQGNPHVIAPQTAEIVKDSVEAMGQGDQSERAFVFGQGTIRNVGIVLTAASSVAVITATGVAVLGLTGAALSAPLSLVIIEATKKSKAFKDVAEPIRKLMDRLSDDDGIRLGEFYQEVDGRTMTRFTLQNEERIRLIAGDRPEYKWLHDQLDWIKANKPKDL